MLAEITTEKIVCSSSKLPVIFHPSLPNSQCCGILGRSSYELQENLSNGNRDTAEKVLRSPSKVPFNYRPIATKLTSRVTHWRRFRV